MRALAAYDVRAFDFFYRAPREPRRGTGVSDAVADTVSDTDADTDSDADADADAHRVADAVALSDADAHRVADAVALPDVDPHRVAGAVTLPDVDTFANCDDRFGVRHKLPVAVRHRSKRYGDALSVHVLHAAVRRRH